jgi:hypothetical protein
MKVTLCAGAVALAMVALLPNAPTATASEFNYAAAGQSQTATTIDVARIHGALRLTAQQEPLWVPVEVALRDIVRQQQAHSEQDGFLKRVSRRVVSIVMTSAAVERLARAARPLIGALNDEQKQTAGNLAQEMGLGPVVMAALR